MSGLAEVLSASHQLHEQLSDINAKISAEWQVLSHDPVLTNKSNLRFTYAELTIIKGSIEASMARLQAMFKVGDQEKSNDEMGKA